MNPVLGPTSRTHILIGAVLAGLQILNGAVMIDTFGAKVGGLFVALIGAVQAGWQVYSSAVTIPTSAVAAVVDSKSGDVVAGPAAEQANGTRLDLSAQEPAA